MINEEFVKKLTVWYEINKRDLPWRSTADPYKIWLSEIILQQTRVIQGLPYYKKFISNFENISALAKADEQDVLRLWQGLGYYSRARNLHQCAKEIVRDFNKKFPEGYKNLMKLPGIGKYTAAAIASFAFKERVPVVDGNVYRVLSRVFGLHNDISTGKGQETFENMAWDLIPEKNPDIHNQAIMEFGAVHCTPKTPKCDDCIFNIECYARINNLQRQLPLKTNKVKVTNRYFNYIVLLTGHREMILTKRTGNDIWKGLYDYPLIETKNFPGTDGLMAQSQLLREIAPYISNVDITNEYKHVLTHRRIYARFYTITLIKANPVKNVLKKYHLKPFTYDQVLSLPKPVLVSRYLNDTIF